MREIASHSDRAGCQRLIVKQGDWRRECCAARARRRIPLCIGRDAADASRVAGTNGGPVWWEATDISGSSAPPGIVSKGPSPGWCGGLVRTLAGALCRPRRAAN